jgi:hypothetical protein
MEQQCRDLLQALPEAIAATEAAFRSGEYGPHPVNREPRTKLENPTGEFRESHWEEALWRKYHHEGSGVVDGLWARILSYQAMLRGNNRDDAGWGEIDLLAVTAEGSPVIVELKREPSSETPLRMLPEGLANAVAIRKCWQIFGPNFNSRITTLGLPCCNPPKTFPVICLAPDSYWHECFRKKCLPSPVRAS